VYKTNCANFWGHLVYDFKAGIQETRSRSWYYIRISISTVNVVYNTKWFKFRYSELESEFRVLKLQNKFRVSKLLLIYRPKDYTPLFLHYPKINPFDSWMHVNDTIYSRNYKRVPQPWYSPHTLRVYVVSFLY